MINFYAGVGSRETPLEERARITEIAGLFEELGLILRSGDAVGADAAFSSGVKNNKNKIIYSPKDILTSADWADGFEHVRKLHPAPHAAFRTTRIARLLARDTFQVIGTKSERDAGVPHSRFVLCWTKDGAETTTSRETGGTGQAIRVALHYGIPVFNLRNTDGLARCVELIRTM